MPQVVREQGTQVDKAVVAGLVPQVVAALGFVMGWAMELLPDGSKPCSDRVRSIWSFDSPPGGWKSGGSREPPPEEGGGGSPALDALVAA